mmetsp:Transcript_16308/g.39036  ORF Transcript_16308/g.39036 Transcript_16308/m.39036 type:complete len:87 (+) Transcript_16308:1142-1402(+)
MHTDDVRQVVEPQRHKQEALTGVILSRKTPERSAPFGMSGMGCSTSVLQGIVIGVCGNCFLSFTIFGPPLPGPVAPGFFPPPFFEL